MEWVATRGKAIFAAGTPVCAVRGLVAIVVSCGSMISIGKFLKGSDARAKGILLHVINLLLEAVEIHTVQADEQEYRQFQSDIHETAARFSDDTPDDEMLILAGALTTRLKEYGEGATRYLKARNTEYKNMVSMLTRTIVTAARGSDSSITQLRQIETQIKGASAMDDVRKIRWTLGQCLESLQAEIRQRELQSTALTAKLQEAVERSQGRVNVPPPDPGFDSLTSLPDRTAAEAAMMEAAASGRCCYAVAVVAARIPIVNARFGVGAGDRMLRHLSDHFREGLMPQDRLFRWRGPSFLILMERAAQIIEIRRSIARIANAPLEEHIEMGSRSITLPISAAWSVFPMMSAGKDIVQKIDQFVDSQASAN